MRYKFLTKSKGLLQFQWATKVARDYWGSEGTPVATMDKFGSKGLEGIPRDGIPRATRDSYGFKGFLGRGDRDSHGSKAFFWFQEIPIEPTAFPIAVSSW